MSEENDNEECECDYSRSNLIDIIQKNIQEKQKEINEKQVQSEVNIHPVGGKSNRAHLISILIKVKFPPNSFIAQEMIILYDTPGWDDDDNDTKETLKVLKEKIMPKMDVIIVITMSRNFSKEDFFHLKDLNVFLKSRLNN